MNAVINEQRKRREFLYYIYRDAKHNNSMGLGRLNFAYTLSISQDMKHNWGFLSNANIAPILHYHLAEGNVSITTPSATPPDNGLSDPVWQRRDLMSIWAEGMFITVKGIKTVESDDELLECLTHNGAIIDWRSKVEKSVEDNLNHIRASGSEENLMNDFEVLKQEVLRISVMLSGGNPSKPVLAGILIEQIRKRNNVSWNDDLLGPIGGLIEDGLLRAFRNNVLVTDVMNLMVMGFKDLDEIYFRITSKSAKERHKNQEKRQVTDFDERQTDHLVQMFKLLHGHCNKSELMALSFSIGVDYEDLDGENKRDKTRELVQYCLRRELMAKLRSEFTKEYPNISLPEIPPSDFYE